MNALAANLQQNKGRRAVNVVKLHNLYTKENSAMKKRKSNNRVLIAAIVLALVIVIGATFAWFTSKDEVTNKLSAITDYNVSITETYTPETNWVPGEEVNKDVALVNTGSTSAFVRAYLSGQFVISALEAEEDYVDAPTATAVTLGIQDKTAEEDQIENTMREEAFKAEAGGYLVFVPNAEAAEAADMLNERNAEIDTDTNGWVKFDALTDDYINDGFKSTVAELINEDGFYIFARVQTVKADNEGAVDEIEYVYDGYYYDGDSYYKISVDSEGNKIELYSNENEAPLTVTPYFYKKSSKVINTDSNSVKITNYEAGTDPNADADREMIQVWYDPDDFAEDSQTYTNSPANDIKINIYLDQDYADNWTKVTDTTADATDINTTYYYKHELIGGETTAKLIDAVELDSTVSNEAFYEFDYYLNVLADSIQAIKGEDKADTAIVNGWAKNADTDREAYNVGATGEGDPNTLEDGTPKSVDVTWTFSN